MLGGLTFSLYAILLGTSGSALVFRDELTELEFPQFHQGPAPTVLNTTPDQALAAVRLTLPGWQVYSITWPNAHSPLWVAYVSRAGQSMEVFLDTQTAHVTGARNTQAGRMGKLAQLHFNLLLGSSTGRLAQGAGVVALLAMCVSGLWLWWPVGGAAFASRFRVDFRAGWRKLSWQLHHVTGAAGILFIVMWAVTGGYYIWMGSYISLVDHFLERAKAPQIEKRPADVGMRPMAELAGLARVQFPGRSLYRMSVPGAPDQPVSVTLLEATPAEFHRVATVSLDPVTGAVLQRSSPADRLAGDRLLGWISVLHFGRWGGLLGKIVWALMGLTLPLLVISGFLMWCRRVIEPRLRPATGLPQVDENKI